jgi:hypothetical protein
MSLFSSVPTGLKYPGGLFPGNKLPGYFQLSLRDMLNLMNSFPGNELPG